MDYLDDKTVYVHVALPSLPLSSMVTTVMDDVTLIVRPGGSVGEVIWTRNFSSSSRILSSVMVNVAHAVAPTTDILGNVITVFVRL